MNKGWDEAQIPQRPWIAPGYLMRGAVTFLAGPGAAGKSSLVVAWATALATGQSFGRFTPPETKLRVSVYNVEDDADEQRRRFSATCRVFGATPYTITPNLAILGPNNVGTLITANPEGRTFNTKTMESLISHLETFRPDVLFLDPFVELHNAEENDNTVSRAVVAHLRRLAQTFNLALVVLHHVRKGILSPGDPDIMRGAGALAAASRVSLTIIPMRDDDADELGIPRDTKKYYVRLDDAKSNYSLLQHAEWFQKTAYELDNGDSVAALVPWKTPADTVTPRTMEAIKQATCQGVGGEPYTFSAGYPRSIHNLANAHGVSAPAAISKLIATMKSEGWTMAAFRSDKSARKDIKGIRPPYGSQYADNFKWAD